MITFSCEKRYFDVVKNGSNGGGGSVNNSNSGIGKTSNISPNNSSNLMFYSTNGAGRTDL